MTHRISIATARLWASLYDCGATLRGIADSAGYDIGTVRRRIAQHTTIRPVKKPVTEETKAKIRAAREAGMTLREIADEIGISIAAAWRHSGTIGQGCRNTKTPDEVRKRIVELRREGLTYEEIARRTGVSLTTAWNYGAMS